MTYIGISPATVGDGERDGNGRATHTVDLTSFNLEVGASMFFPLWNNSPLATWPMAQRQPRNFCKLRSKSSIVRVAGAPDHRVRMSAPLLRNSVPVIEASRTDYAVCAGDSIIHTPPAPPSTNPVDLNSYAWPPFHSATGISYVRTQIRMAAVTDGTSNTAMIGEKYLARQHYRSGESWGDDQSPFVGDDGDNRRWADVSPRRDDSADDIQHFGSAHSGGCQFVLCDGSVRMIAYEIDAIVFKNLGNRQDGNPLQLGK
jgi:prepilin-type processing-associated H-X9-DG protein